LSIGISRSNFCRTVEVAAAERRDQRDVHLERLRVVARGGGQHLAFEERRGAVDRCVDLLGQRIEARLDRPLDRRA
jgi:hypothetical protein